MIIDTLKTGGKERRLIELLKGLDRAGIKQVMVVVLSDIVEYPAIYDLDYPVVKIKRKSKRDLGVLTRLNRICKEFKPEVIHGWESMVAIYALPIAKIHGAKFINGMVVDSPRSLKVGESRWLRSALTFPFSDAIVGNSQAGLTAYKAPKKKSHCIYNGFDHNRINNLKDATAIRQELGLQDKRVVGMVGAFSSRKDYPTYIAAAQLLLARFSDLVFLAIGTGPLFQECQDLVPAEFKSQIVFTGNRKDVESIVNVFEVGVLSSTHGEGISNSVLEYMALEKPVVATGGGGTPELVAHEQSGFIVALHNVQEMADRIGYLLEHPQKAAEMGKKGRQILHDTFRLDKMTQNYITLYQTLIKK